MRIKAYILAADPAWIEASVLSYYNIVEEIIVSYDERKLGWTGSPIAVDECLERLRRIDHSHKMRFSPGHYARLNHSPMENDTYQRQCALAEASKDADWVLQFDTDEVLTDTSEFLRCLEVADKLGYKGVDYPARWLYKHIGDDKYLEACNRFGGIAAGYPGPVAVRPGTQLSCARQCTDPVYRVDFKRKNTDPYRSKNAPVHQIIKPDQGIIHYAWVRDEEKLRKKFSSSSHALEYDWNREVNDWISAGRHPYTTVITSPLRRRSQRKFRLSTIRLPKHIEQYTDAR